MLFPADVGGRHPKSVEQHKFCPKQRKVADWEYDCGFPCPSDGPHKEHYKININILKYETLWQFKHLKLYHKIAYIDLYLSKFRAMACQSILRKSIFLAASSRAIGYKTSRRKQGPSQQ